MNNANVDQISDKRSKEDEDELTIKKRRTIYPDTVGKSFFKLVEKVSYLIFKVLVSNCTNKIF